MRRHPELADRLGDHRAKTFGFDPVDLPFAFVIRPEAGAIEAVRRLPAALDAAASGPFFALLALLEGRVDGDALFFSREIEVSGDMEAILALRNALDDCGIDLPTELAASSGPLGPLMKAACERVRARVLERGAWN
ncbi:hypothetical protein SLNSH_15190 [Alsobacter soli]|uniref:SCP2 domain-containing protein n=2 Tax=Alsobacter soli TaxID=2109933 RepID=A0A2T1HRQ7_9HYPH|nr:hypothetical protein SLNSH_15190 [Alsobacter soli]